jgi:hypothetical protein
MNVIVRPINVRGKPMRTAERMASKMFAGVLQVREERNNLLGRAFTQAELVSPIDGQRGSLLPPLIDARILWLKKNEIRMTGMEVVEDMQYYQTWVIEVQ